MSAEVERWRAAVDRYATSTSATLMDAGDALAMRVEELEKELRRIVDWYLNPGEPGNFNPSPQEIAYDVLERP